MLTLRIRDWDRHFENSSSRKLKRLEWVAIPNKMDGEGYCALVDHENGAAHLGAWVAIVEVASKQDPRGNLPTGGSNNTIGGICQSIGRICRLPGRIFHEALPRLIEIGWIEQVPSNQQSATTSGESADVSADSGRKVAAQGREGKGITGNGTTTTSHAVNSNSEFPAILAEIRKHDAAADDVFCRSLMQTVIQKSLSDPKFPHEQLENITDENVARCVAESYRSGPRNHGTGLLLSRVPNIVKTWALED